MHSCVYEGYVWHSRREPTRHRFRYALSMLYLDLDELSTAFSQGWLWSAKRSAVVWFRRADYLGDARVPLDVAVRHRLESEGIERCGGPIRVLTQPRYFGFLMNPVSFYFCFDRGGTPLRAVIAEVTNTPWGERHSYVLAGDALTSDGEQKSLRLSKQLHVSPFMPMDMEYQWRLTAPGAGLQIDIRNYGQSRHVFSASLRLKRREWCAAELWRALWRYPFMTQRIAVGIYWQAFRLWWKGCPVYRHPASCRRSTNQPAS